MEDTYTYTAHTDNTARTITAKVYIETLCGSPILESRVRTWRL